MDDARGSSRRTRRVMAGGATQTPSPVGASQQSLQRHPPGQTAAQTTPLAGFGTPEPTGRTASGSGDGRRRPPRARASPPLPRPFRIDRSIHFGESPRLSMQVDSDDSGSEPEFSLLGIGRTASGPNPPMGAGADAYDEAAGDDLLSHDQYEAEDTSIEDQETTTLVDPTTVGLKEISNLGKFTVSSHKPGSGVDELRSDDLKLYWQSDGPQPHKLTIYFVKRVGIRDIRFFVDYNEDESYTPTKIVFKSGTSENNLIEFATMNLDSPVGWQQVPIAGAGGEPDGNTLVSYVLQMQVLENHQNGKDTHLRGIKMYVFDIDTGQGAGRESSVTRDAWDSGSDRAGAGRPGDMLDDIARTLAEARLEPGEAGFVAPDFMREPELR